MGLRMVILVQAKSYIRNRQKNSLICKNDVHTQYWELKLPIYGLLRTFVWTL